MAARALPLPLCGASSPHRATLLAWPCRAAVRPLASPVRWPARSDSPSPQRAGGLALAPCAAKHGGEGGGEVVSEDGGGGRPLLQAALWGAEAAYILWLFLLPYAPGDPVWAISQATISDLIGLSLNFFFILPLLDSAGVHLLESPVLHPMAEGFFNFVIAWTLLFVPLLFTDSRRDRFKGSLNLLWDFQMLLTNSMISLTRNAFAAHGYNISDYRQFLFFSFLDTLHGNPAQ